MDAGKVRIAVVKKYCKRSLKIRGLSAKLEYLYTVKVSQSHQPQLSLKTNSSSPPEI